MHRIGSQTVVWFGARFCGLVLSLAVVCLKEETRHRYGPQNANRTDRIIRKLQSVKGKNRNQPQFVNLATKRNFIIV